MVAHVRNSALGLDSGSFGIFLHRMESLSRWVRQTPRAFSAESQETDKLCIGLKMLEHSNSAGESRNGVFVQWVRSSAGNRAHKLHGAGARVQRSR